MESSLIWVTASKPINAKTHSGEKVFQPGEAFQVNPVKAKPLIEKNILEEVAAPLDEFWQKDILPRLSRLHMAGRLPDLATCPGWSEVDRLWGVSSPDVERVKAAMKAAVETYEASSHSRKGSKYDQK